ncbi:hypothetical protein Dsin_002250 [Dipteronia sinensis]|uniref:Endonuclease/exonuclease/phosphatase domain-containing protein n=1 Tax=Dipteronia sinensis TaxID=43782 RepID=A0AAE0B6U9_9ROSI|nr:hypothetical protein Dsin_002250 [Dipteronia sinensis]
MVSLTVNSRLHFYTFVYASTSAVVRRLLWQSLRDLVSLVSSSWLVVGDFNAVLGAHESLGLCSPGCSSYEDFRFVVEDCDLIGVRSYGARVTWAKGRYPHTRIERRELFLAESRVHHELDVLLHRHECFYRERSRVKWMQDGDRNSSFFHASIRRRQYMNALSSLLINEVLTNDRLIIRDHIIEFYSNLFSSDSSRFETEFSLVEDVIPSLVTNVENDFLISFPSTDNIHDAVFTMDTASAPGSDSFSGGFY